jgi:hypothetical protein
MSSDAIAQQLRAKGYGVVSVVAQPAWVRLPDDQILSHATGEGRALVSANIKDFMPLDSRYRAAGQAHPGLILVSTKTFSQDRAFTAAITAALETLLSGADKVQPGQVLFLTRGQVVPASDLEPRSRVGGSVAVTGGLEAAVHPLGRSTGDWQELLAGAWGPP